jgi:hypothetical protein
LYNALFVWFVLLLILNCWQVCRSLVLHSPLDRVPAQEAFIPREGRVPDLNHPDWTLIHEFKYFD